MRSSSGLDILPGIILISFRRPCIKRRRGEARVRMNTCVICDAAAAVTRGPINGNFGGQEYLYPLCFGTAL